MRDNSTFPESSSIGNSRNKQSRLLRKFLYAIALIVSCQCSLRAQLPSDTSICRGQVITLFTDQSYEFYNWAATPGILWSVGPQAAINPLDTQVYSVIGRRRLDQELVLDGDFEGATPSFYSSLDIQSASDFPLGTVSIVSNSGELSGVHDACPDLSGDPDASFLAIQGIQGEQHNVWCQEIEIVAGKSYGFSAQVATLTSMNGGNFAFSIDGIQVGGPAPPESISCTWRGYLRDYTATESKIASVCVTHTSSSSSPATAAVDKISFRPYDVPYFDTIIVAVRESPDTSRINVSVCDGQGFEYQGSLYPPGRTYELVYPQPGLCDSILLLSIEKVEFLSTQIIEQHCTGHQIRLENGQRIFLDRDTSFTEALTSQYGCDSLIEHDYVVLDPQDLEVSFTRELCDANQVTARLELTDWPDAIILWPDGSTGRIRENLEEDLEIVLEIVSSSGCSINATIQTPPSLTVPEVAIVESPSCFLTPDGIVQITSAFDISESWTISLVDPTDEQRDIQLLNNSLTIFELQAGTYSLVLRTEFGCEARTEFTLAPSQSEQFELQGTTNLFLGESTSLFISGAPQFQEEDFNWTGPSFLQGSPSGRSQELGIPRSGRHSITLQLDSTCAQKLYFELIVRGEDSPLYANAFSPNGDANNDVFKIQPHPFISEVIYLRLYNRWGNLVYNGKNNPAGWSPVDYPIGVYLFESEVRFENGDLRMYKGSLNLLR